jgi:3-dehydroquinate synthetase
MASLPPPEGIRVHHQQQGLLAEITRHDVTSVRITQDGFLRAVGELIEAGGFAIVDGNVFAAWADRLSDVLPKDRFLVLAPGEDNKTLSEVERIITRLHESGVHRKATLVGVGGGVTTDLVGLVAALYFRGVRAAYVPTTLLAMIDAAIGGKIGVNHPRQKNLIGQFSHPTQIRICLDALTTLPTAERISAYGEALKIAIIDSPELLGLLAGLGEPPSRGDLNKLVRICVTKKLQLLGNNAFERSLDRALNLGHTVAHPLEDITAFRIRHGTAVGIGIAVASHIAVQRGLLERQVFEQILRVMNQLGLPVMATGFDAGLLTERIERLVLQRGGRSLHYVLPVAIGKVSFTDHITAGELGAALAELGSRHEEPACAL